MLFALTPAAAGILLVCAALRVPATPDPDTPIRRAFASGRGFWVSLALLLLACSAILID